MRKLINNLLGDYSSREIKRIMPIVEKIEALDNDIAKLSNEELREKTQEFKNRIKNGESLDDILPEAFAVVREASFRVLGMKHYRVQLIGGIVLHQGRIAEMKTGEGKTLVATCPSYLNALTGKGVHIVTSNEYLAKRDCEEMGQVHEFLGLTTGVILHEMDAEERREVYKKDIVYGINSEIGFDYLKDNMIMSKEERVQRGLNYAIVDEIDSILIDEARTPLIISGDGEEATEYYITVDEFVRSLEKDEHYEVDEKKRAVTLTSLGIEKLEKHFNIANYADIENIKLQHHITQSLKAHYTMSRDIDYIENDEGEILIVDTFTGRVMEGRRFSDGLHQAIEAKERVDIQAESQTLATITLQNLFRIYSKLSGMSGTVVTEEDEFRQIYSLDVIVIPTNKPVKRIDNEDKVYVNIAAKYNAVVEEIIECHKKGQPVLVGTASIQKSEDISALLKRKRVPHNVLNAKNHENESKIVEKAGNKGSITIATNMAGRGTDIKLSDEVKELGGLKVIGTERHDSVRVDNQLRGRAGRQGDPGESIFYVSLDDDVIKNYIPDRYRKLVDKIVSDENSQLDPTIANKAVDNAQRAVEGDNYAARKDIVGYDDSINKQRELIYKQRNEVLDKESLRDNIEEMIKVVVQTLVKNSMNNINKRDNNEGIFNIIRDEINELSLMTNEEFNNFIKNKYNMDEKIIDMLYNKYLEFIKENEEDINSIERKVMLEAVDKLWIEYLNDIEILRQGINLRSYKQVDPVQVFQLESSKMFNEMSYKIKENTVSKLFKLINEGAVVFE